MKAGNGILAAFLRAVRPEQETIVLRQSLMWSRGIMWTIMGVAVTVVIWACFARMDEVIHAPGRLEPRGSVREVQSPVPGVVSAILVKDGDVVKAGQVLVKLDPKVATAELQSLSETLRALKAEGDFYKQLFAEKVADQLPQSLAPEIAGLAKDRATLQAENQLLRAQINFSLEGVELTSDQANLFKESEKDRQERIRQADFRVLKAEKELASTTEQLELSRKMLENSRQVFESYRKLLETGGVARVIYLAREAETLKAENDVQLLESRIVSLKIEVDRAREESLNINTSYRKEAMTRLSENTKRIAEIESGLTKARLQNAQRISEVESRLAGSTATLGYHEIVSPADGVVFEVVSSKPGTVVAPRDVIVKIVPSDELIAKIDITNRDIGFTGPGLACEVEIDSFPSREYGHIDGRIYFVGSDVLPPTNVKQFYSFPAKIELQSQTLKVRGKPVPLQSGMAVSANIKVRSKLVISLFLDFLLGPLDHMKEVR